MRTQKSPKRVVGIIGSGNMAEAIISRIRNDFEIIAADKRKERCAYIKKKYKVRVLADNKALCQQARVVILAVKPQDMKEVLSEVSAVIKNKHLLISIAAGIRTDYIESRLKTAAAVTRVMPNTPALVGYGMSAICRGRFAKETDLNMTEKIFASVGEVVRIKEKFFDAVTALSGSGPGFLAYFLEAFVQAATGQGLSKEQAAMLAIETMLGTAQLLKLTRIAPAELMHRVASRGGTTEAGLLVLEKYKQKDIIKEVIAKACQRAKELAEQR